MLSSVSWKLVTDVSGQLIGPIFKVEAVQEECQEQMEAFFCIGDGVGCDWFPGKAEKTIRLLDCEVATRTWGGE
jgi:hypothetical protein